MKRHSAPPPLPNYPYKEIHKIIEISFPDQAMEAI